MYFEHIEKDRTSIKLFPHKFVIQFQSKALFEVQLTQLSATSEPAGQTPRTISGGFERWENPLRNIMKYCHIAIENGHL
jgi:hypothetical protein